ncbi:hypothetical protein BJ742DRAFT_799117 [Cladochytrium replicatum]|nr:hypothetical protein BJ742DRAFT_799117 [Cladochytrium replicatum]
MDQQRLNVFLLDCLAFGSLKGFRWFELYMRGREEVIVRVKTDQMGINQSRSSSYSDRSYRDTLPKSRSKLLNVQSGLPPASPCDRETEKDTTKTAILIAGYARYGRPFVWIRSNHRTLMKVQEGGIVDEDLPLKLRSTDNWCTSDIKIFDVVEDIVTLFNESASVNPFAVDHGFFHKLSLNERTVTSGAMVDFLLRTFNRNSKFASEVLKDIHLLLECHFTSCSSNNTSA